MGKLIKLFRYSALALILTFVIFLSGVLLVKSSLGDSAIAPEPANIAAGYGYVRYLDDRLDPAQPLLSKAVSALPLLLQRPSFPLSSLNWQRDINGSQEVGWQFLYQSGNDSNWVINTARLFPIIFSLLLLLAVYWWAKELMGKWWALLPTFLLAFYPTLLANGHYATPASLTALSIFAALFSFLNFLNLPSRKKLFIAGVALGIAQLANFASLILIPVFAIIFICFYLNNTSRDWMATEPSARFHRFSKRAARYLESFLFILLIGFLVVAAAYILLTLGYPALKQQSDTQFILNSFQPKGVADAVVVLAGVPVIRGLAQYLLGILVNIPAEIGSVSKIPVALLLKTPLPGALLILIALFAALTNIAKSAWNMLRRRNHNLSDYLSTNFSEFSMMLLIAAYWPVAIIFFPSSGLAGLLPTLPFVFILTASGIRRWISGTELTKSKNLMIKIFLVYEEFFQISVKTAAVTALVVSYFVTALIAYPNFLAYANIAAGGTKNAYQYLTGADYDLGQDLARFKIWAAANLPAGEKIAVDYYGGADIKNSLGDLAEVWESSKGNPNNNGINWLAVSATALNDAKKSPNAEDQYLWLTSSASAEIGGWRTFARAGTTIFIYKL